MRKKNRIYQLNMIIIMMKQSIYGGRGFSVQNNEWLGFSNEGEEAESFSILNDLEPLIREPTYIPDCSNQFWNALDICLTIIRSNHKYAILIIPPCIITR